MAAFDGDADITHATDFQIARAGGVVLYRRPHVLDDAVRSLVDLGYDVVRLDAASWTTPSTMHDEVARALGFPAYYGRNLDALTDCLSDVARGDYGLRLETTGLALVVVGFEAYRDQCPEQALGLIDVLAATTRTGLLYGHRVLSLLQVGDANLQLGPVGGGTIPWNGAEWLDRSREKRLRHASPAARDRPTFFTSR